MFAYAVEEPPDGSDRRSDHTDPVEADVHVRHGVHRDLRPGHSRADVDECRTPVPGDRAGVGRHVCSTTPTARHSASTPRPATSTVHWCSTRRHRAAVLRRSDRTPKHDIDADFERLLEAIPLDAPRPTGLVEQLLDLLHPSGLHDDDIAVLAVTVRLITAVDTDGRTRRCPPISDRRASPRAPTS